MSDSFGSGQREWPEPVGWAPPAQGPLAQGYTGCSPGASLASWAELKMNPGTRGRGAAREPELWNTLPTLGLGCVFTLCPPVPRADRVWDTGKHNHRQ